MSLSPAFYLELAIAVGTMVGTAAAIWAALKSALVAMSINIAHLQEGHTEIKAEVKSLRDAIFTPSFKTRKGDRHAS